jgi:hypothetical protein
MRFKQYLTEQNVPTLDEINELITSNCKPYLKLIKNKEPLYRGIDSPDIMGSKIVRQNRRPRGSMDNEFAFINQWLGDHGHNRRDNTMICISSKGKSSAFGIPCYVFPIGKLSYTWMDSKDFNYNDRKTGWYNLFVQHYLESKYYYDGKPIEEYEKDYSTRMNKPFADYFHTDKGFNIAYKNEYEIWIKCKEYYYIMANWIKLRNMKWQNGQFWQM